MKAQRKTKAQLIKELAELRQSEERYRQFFESANDAIVSLTLDGIITVINRGAELLLGWSREEQLGRHYSTFLTPSSFVFTQERARRIQAGEKVPSIYEIELVRKDGSVVPVEARSRFIRDQAGKPLGILATHRDITVRKQAEEALRESEERFRLLVESVQDYAIFLLDPAGHVITWNRGAERIKGYRAEEILGQHYARFYRLDDQAQGKPARQLRVAAKEGQLEDEGWRVRKDGEQFWANTVLTALSDERGAVRGFAKVTRDMTARKQAEEEKQKLQEQLFQARKLEALGTLAGGVAHDFSNILSAIMGFTELATDEVPEGTLVRRHLDEVLKASRRAKTLVQQILTFSRPSQQNHEPLEPYPTIEEVLMFLRASLPPTIEIRYVIDKTAGPVALSSSQLQQVLTNLCANAIQALGEKGGELEVCLQRTEMEDDFARTQKNLRPGPYLKLSISDTGCGMAPAVQERIFEPFFTTRPVGEGNGLGLAIVHGIVTGHGGAITVDSTPGKGTTFHVYLPISESDVVSANALHCLPPPADADSPDKKGALSDAVHFSH